MRLATGVTADQSYFCMPRAGQGRGEPRLPRAELTLPSPQDEASGQSLLISAGMWTLPDSVLCAECRFWDNEGRIMWSQQ